MWSGVKLFIIFEVLHSRGVTIHRLPMHHDSDCHDSAIVIVFSTIDNFHQQSLQLLMFLIVIVPVDFLHL